MEISVPVEVCNGAENERGHPIVQWNQAIFASDIKNCEESAQIGEHILGKDTGYGRVLRKILTFILA